jgi:hypothetical protein
VLTWVGEDRFIGGQVGGDAGEIGGYRRQVEFLE